MLRGLYNWTMSLAQSRFAYWILAVISFVEASVFPIPPDAMIIPMVIAKPRRAFFIAGISTIFSVLGGALGYYIGAVLMIELGKPILEFYHLQNSFANFAVFFNDNGIWALLISGVTPFPFKVVTILSGATGLNFVTFVLASIVARALRFFIVAALLWKFGEPIREFIEKRLGWVFVAFMVLLIGGFLVLAVL